MPLFRYTAMSKKQANFAGVVSADSTANAHILLKTYLDCLVQEVTEDGASEYAIVIDAMCCVMIADGRATKAEKTRVYAIVKQWPGCNLSVGDVKRLMDSFVHKVRSVGFAPLLDLTLHNAVLVKRHGRLRELLSALRDVADVDGQCDPKEHKVIGLFKSSLTSERAETDTEENAEVYRHLDESSSGDTKTREQVEHEKQTLLAEADKRIRASKEASKWAPVDARGRRAIYFCCAIQICVFVVGWSWGAYVNAGYPIAWALVIGTLSPFTLLALKQDELEAANLTWVGATCVFVIWGGGVAGSFFWCFPDEMMRILASVMNINVPDGEEIAMFGIPLTIFAFFFFLAWANGQLD